MSAGRVGLVGAAARAQFGGSADVAGRNRHGGSRVACQGEVCRREIAGLPEQEELFQTAENAREACHDERVHGIRNPGARLQHLRGAAQAGDPFAEGG